MKFSICDILDFETQHMDLNNLFWAQVANNF